MPLIALVIPPVQAAAVVLPILIVQDVVGVWAFRRTVDWRMLAVLMPGTVIGVGLGYLFATQVSVKGVLGMVGGLSVLFGVHRLWRSEEHTSELQSLMRISYAVFCLTTKKLGCTPRSLEFILTLYHLRRIIVTNY